MSAERMITTTHLEIVTSQETSMPRKKIHSMSAEDRTALDGRFGEFYVKYYDRMKRHAYRFIKDEETAEDIVQDSFLNAYEAFAEFEENNAPSGAWIYKITANKARDYLRARKRQAFASDEAVINQLDVDQDSLHGRVKLVGMSPRPEEVVLQHEQSDEVIGEINKLPHDSKEAIYQVHIFERKGEDIAQNLHIELGTIRTRTFRARNILKQSPVLQDQLSKNA